MPDANQIPIWQQLQPDYTGPGASNTQQMNAMQAELDKLTRKNNRKQKRQFQKMYGPGGNPAGMIGGTPSKLEDAWLPGAQEAEQIYNMGGLQLDPSGNLDATMANLMAMQDPQQNPYLLDMLQTGQQSIADQTMSSLGLSGRGPGTIDPMTGQVSDSAINLINNVGDFTSDFLRNQYQQDMARAMNAINSGRTVMPDVMQLQQRQPWQNLQNYSNVVSQLTGASTQQPNDPKTSGWDKLMGIGKIAIGGKVAGLF